MVTLFKSQIDLPAIDLIDPRLLAQLIAEALFPITYRWREEKAEPFGDGSAAHLSISRLTSDDKAYLAHVWRDLPPLPRVMAGGRYIGCVITAREFTPYSDALEADAGRPRWSLHVQHVVDHGRQLQAQTEHEHELRRRIETGSLTALTKNGAPTQQWSNVDRVAVQDVVAYLNACGLDVRNRDADSPTASTPPARPQQVTAQQDAVVIAKLRELGFDPLALPKPPPGKEYPVKEQVRKALNFTDAVFNKAWQRLRTAKSIKEQGAP